MRPYPLVFIIYARTVSLYRADKLAKLNVRGVYLIGVEVVDSLEVAEEEMLIFRCCIN